MQQPYIIDNQSLILKNDLLEKIKEGSRVSIVAACFSMYAYQQMKRQLSSVKDFRFIYTSPTFTKDTAAKKQREFYIPRMDREHSLYGTEYEIKLRNEMTQKSVAQECAQWISEKATFKSNVSGEMMNGFLVLEGGKGDSIVYSPLNGFTTVDLGCERGNNSYTMMMANPDPQAVKQFLSTFDHLWKDKDKLQDVTETIMENISNAYKENSPELIYFMALYHIFSEFLKDISEDDLPNELTGFKQSKIWQMLYDFQKDAVLAIINKLEKYNGCILADSVGLGKTFTSLAVIKYYENRNKSVLVLCPKKLSENWNTYKGNYINNPIAEDRLNYDVLYHTDLSRTRGFSNGIDLGRLKWGNYDLVVIDESHNFRNGGQFDGESEKENRYARLMKKVIQDGVKTKVLMLSATPVNNRFTDLKNQLQLAYEGNTAIIDQALNTKKSIDDIFRQAQAAYNHWSTLPPEKRTTQALLNELDFDFFELLDSVTIARSRNHIRKYYDAEKIGNFPHRRKPVSIQTQLTDLPDAITYHDIYEKLNQLNLAIYIPSNYIQPSRRYRYEEKAEGSHQGLTQLGRELGIRRLMGVNLLKRLESSVYAFSKTLQKVKGYIESVLEEIDKFKKGQHDDLMVAEREFIFDDDDTDFSVGRKVKIRLEDMDYISWEKLLREDVFILSDLLQRVEEIEPLNDKKLQNLISYISEKVHHPINEGNRKVLIFSAFADTATYIYQQISAYFKVHEDLESALITGTADGKCTIPKLPADFNTVLTLFSPISKDKAAIYPQQKRDIDILVATDCISEGQNLQDCDCVINYDIHWNPVRLIQRFGRIDRIGSRNKEIQMVNFWPDVSLDEYIQLKARVESKMKIAIMTGTGDDNPLTPEEEGDLAYRKEQLKKLKEEVVDMEDMGSGISIMDLGLNEFRMDLLEYVKTHKEIEHLPHGLHAVVPAEKGMPRGAFFILRNINDSVNIDHRNRIHPFYMVYVGEDGEILCDYLQPKDLLDTLRKLCKGKEAPIKELYEAFNKETKDGKDMSGPSSLLSAAIDSILHVKEKSDIESLFSSGGTSALLSSVNGLDDFELICFLMIR